MTTVTRRYQGEENLVASGTSLKSFWFATKVLGDSDSHVFRNASLIGFGSHSNTDGYAELSTVTKYFDESAIVDTAMAILRTYVDRKIVNTKSTARSMFLSTVFSFQHQSDCVTKHEVFSDDVVSIKLCMRNTSGMLDLFGTQFNIDSYGSLLLSSSEDSATSRMLRLSLFSTLTEYPIVGSYAACTFDAEFGIVGYTPMFKASMQRSIYLGKRWQYETTVESRS